MNKHLSLLVIIFLLSGCATTGQIDGLSAIKLYSGAYNRDQVAILRVKQTPVFSIIFCDGMRVYRNTEYVVLLPGRHKIWFRLMGETLLETFWITNKKYLDAEAGHTYILKTKGAGIVVVGNKWYPDVIDVTNDSKLNVTDIPIFAATPFNFQPQNSDQAYNDSKLEIPTMSEGVPKK